MAGPVCSGLGEWVLDHITQYCGWVGSRIWRQGDGLGLEQASPKQSTLLVRALSVASDGNSIEMGLSKKGNL